MSSTQPELNEILAADLSSVTRRYGLRHGLSLEEAAKHVNELKKFLFVVSKNPDDVYAPSVTVDKVWHELIRHTATYREFCDRYLGGFVDHEPGDGTFDAKNAYQRTLNRLNERCGGYDPAVWPPLVKGETAETNVAPCSCDAHHSLVGFRSEQRSQV